MRTLVIAAALLALAGCSSSGHASSPSTTPPNTSVAPATTTSAGLDSMHEAAVNSFVADPANSAVASAGASGLATVMDLVCTWLDHGVSDAASVTSDTAGVVTNDISGSSAYPAQVAALVRAAVVGVCPKYATEFPVLVK